jgi:hypothetical protein
MTKVEELKEFTENDAHSPDRLNESKLEAARSMFESSTGFYLTASVFQCLPE